MNAAVTKTRILYLSHSPYFNGAEICLLTLLKYIDKSRFEPIVVFPLDGPLVDEVKKMSIKTYIVALERWIRYPFDISLKDANVQSRVQQIADIIEKEAIQIVHTNTAIIYEGALAAKIKNIPHIWHIHETLENHPELKPIIPLSTVYWVLSFLADAVVTPADLVNRQFLKIIRPSKLVTIYNGIDAKQFENVTDTSIRAELGLSEEDVLAVSVGGLTERKGYVNLLKAASLARKHNKSIQFVWAGPATDQALHDFKTKAREWDVQNAVSYLGFRRDVPQIMKGADIFILPSMNEAFPLVILEAMAAGKAVIATDCGGVRECVIEGETGFIVPVNDPDSLSRKLIELAASEERRSSLGENGLKRFHDYFTAEIYTQNFEDLYRNCIKGKTEALTTQEQLLFEDLMQAYQEHSDIVRILSEREHELIAREQKITEQQQQITEQQQQLAEQQQQLTDKDRHITELVREMSEHDKILAEKDLQLTILLNTWSWRLTAPLRRLSRLIRKEGDQNEA